MSRRKYQRSGFEIYSVWAKGLGPGRRSVISLDSEADKLKTTSWDNGGTASSDDVEALKAISRVRNKSVEILRLIISPSGFGDRWDGKRQRTVSARVGSASGIQGQWGKLRET
eukprot:160121-Amorphochlora_amoeboformis.AAC.1